MNLDPNEFLSQAQTAGFDTKFVKVEPGEYVGTIDGLKLKQYPKKDNPSESSTMVDITFAIDDARQRELTGLDKPTVRQTIFLDIADKKIDRSKGKNVGLGRLLDALGINQDDRTWSFNDLIGRACVVKVEQSENEKDPTDPYVNVTKVGKIGG